MVIQLSTSICCVNHHSNVEESKVDSVYIFPERKISIPIDSLTGDSVIRLVRFYFDFNVFIIDTIDGIYYHENHFNYSPPVPDYRFPAYHYLRQKDFIKMDNLEGLLERIKDNSRQTENVYLIPNKDTVTDSRYFELKSMLIDYGIHVSTRPHLEEEFEILYSILSLKEYEPEKVKWSRTYCVPTRFNFYNDLLSHDLDSIIIDADTCQ